MPTAAGDLSASALQILAVGWGLTALIAASGAALAVIKWAVMAYLIWLTIRVIRKAKPDDPKTRGAKRNISLGNLWMQRFLTSAANPKAVVFFATLFPQFTSAEQPF
ncbi:LysE family transporter [Salipiger sp. 1_MG-2023]|nr:LysE family transporter [Salipiger sp. 1_MG-2023]MDO6585131.1 LysE family transporter [Salipiger sp. 1_MG-2023]